MELPRHPSWKTEIIGLFVTLTLIQQSSFSSLCSSLPTGSTHGYPEFSGFNSAIFNIRARGSNNGRYWIFQIIGSILIGLLLD
ncbi:hypothetical protein EDD85DRAFT_800557 [Armillaria nabsnona]|nr:hypothetical protein EDD85DRAFT_800557 [Armillaria nabsnona]